MVINQLQVHLGMCVDNCEEARNGLPEKSSVLARHVPVQPKVEPYTQEIQGDYDVRLRLATPYSLLLSITERESPKTRRLLLK